MTNANQEIQDFVDYLADGGDANEFTPEQAPETTETAPTKNGDTFLVVNWWVPVMFAAITLSIFLLTRKKK